MRKWNMGVVQAAIAGLVNREWTAATERSLARTETPDEVIDVYRRLLTTDWAVRLSGELGTQWYTADDLPVYVAHLTRWDYEDDQFFMIDKEYAATRLNDGTLRLHDDAGNTATIAELKEALKAMRALTGG